MRWSGRATERPLKERMEEAEVFVERAGKRLANANASIIQAEEALKDPMHNEFAYGWRSCAQRAVGVSIRHHVHIPEERETMELRSSVCTRWSTSCKQSETLSRTGLQQHDVVAEPLGRSPVCGKIPWSTQWKSWCTGCTFPNRTSTTPCLEATSTKSAGWQSCQGAVETVEPPRGASERVHVGKPGQLRSSRY